MKIFIQNVTDDTFNSPVLVTETTSWRQDNDTLGYKVLSMPEDFFLYKYGKRKYLESCLKDGVVSFGIAAGYNDTDLTMAQQDDETSRKFFPDVGKHEILSGPANAPIKNLVNMKISLPIQGHDGKELRYYIWCASKAMDSSIGSKFDADCFLKIKNSKEFFRRLENVCRGLHPHTPSGPGCDFYGRDVTYCDTAALPPSTNQLKLIFTKDKSYEYQQEFRLIFVIDPLKSSADRQNFSIGNIEDIAELIDLY